VHSMKDKDAVATFAHAAARANIRSAIQGVDPTTALGKAGVVELVNLLRILGVDDPETVLAEYRVAVDDNGAAYLKTFKQSLRMGERAGDAELRASPEYQATADQVVKGAKLGKWTSEQ